MTRKHFTAIARIIEAQADAADTVEKLGVVSRIAYGLADEFAAENPRFDRYRFLAACGLLLPANDPH